MTIENIRLGQQYYCLLKTSTVDPEKEKKEFVYHITKGYVSAKGLQVDGDKVLPFVEIAGQRVKATHITETLAECVVMADSLTQQLEPAKEPLPEQP